MFVGFCNMNQCSVPTRNQQLLYTGFLLQKGRRNVTLHLGITVSVCVIIALVGIYNIKVNIFM